MARSFAPGDYGIWIQIYAAMELLAAIGCMGLQRSLIRFWHQRKRSGTLARDLSSMLFAVAFVCVVLAIVAAGAGDLAAAFLWDEPKAGAHFDLFLFLLPLSALSQLVLTAFRAERRMVMHSTLLITESTGFVALAILLLSQGGGVREVLLALAATRLVTFSIGYATIIRHIGWRMPSIDSLGKFLAFGLPLLPIGMFMWVSNLSDRFIISHYAGPGAVAEYSIHYSIGSLMGLFFSPVFFTLIPTITQLWEQGRRDAIHEYLMYAQKYPMLIIAPTAVILALHADRVIALVATKAYSGSPWLILGIAAGVTLLNLAALAENIACLAQGTRVIPVIYGLVAASNVVMNLVAVPLWGIRGAALVTLATYGMQFAAMHWHARRSFEPFINWGIYLRIMIATTVMYVIADVAGDSVALSLTLACCAYLGALVATGCIEHRDLALLRAIFSFSVGGIPRAGVR